LSREEVEEEVRKIKEKKNEKAFFDLAAQKKRLKILARSIILHTFAARNRHSYDKTTF